MDVKSVKRSIITSANSGIQQRKSRFLRNISQTKCQIELLICRPIKKPQSMSRQPITQIVQSE